MDIHTGLWISIAVFIGAIVMGAVLWDRRKRRKRRSGTVVPLQGKRKGPGSADTQPCSRCRKRRKLTYYANDAGVVSGLCTECKKVLERHQELYPM